MLVPRGRFYRRQKTRSRTGSASIFPARCGPRRVPQALQRPLATRKRTFGGLCGLCGLCVWRRCGAVGGAGQWPAALPLLIGHRIIVIRPQGNRIHTRASEYTADHTYMRSSKIQRERERERRERERESLMQQGMVMHVTVLRLTCNGLRSRAGASCELGAPSQRRTLSSACSARRTWSTQSVSGLGRVLRSDPRTSRTYCGAT